MNPSNMQREILPGGRASPLWHGPDVTACWHRQQLCLRRAPSPASPARGSCAARCQRNGSSATPSGDGEQGPAWDSMAEELLRQDPAAAARFERLAEAQRRVSELMIARAQVEEEQRRAMLASPAEAAFQERQQAQRASERGAQCDVLSAEVAVAEAEEQLLAVKLARLQLSRDARKDADRVESGKAATLAGAVGGLASLPYALTTSPSVLTALVSAASAGVSAALFGIVYRYARREDGDTDSQLKGGAVAAFAVVRTLAMVDSRVQTEALTPATLSYEVLKPFALIALAQLFIFAFASVALEAALTKGFLAPIPGDRMAD